MEMGRQEGIIEGRKEGINNTIRVMIEFGADDETIVSKIKTLYKLSDEKAKEYYNNFYI